MYYFRAVGNDNIAPDCLLNYHGKSYRPTSAGLREFVSVSHYGGVGKFAMLSTEGKVVQIPKSRTFVSFG